MLMIYFFLHERNVIPIVSLKSNIFIRFFFVDDKCDYYIDLI